MKGAVVPTTLSNQVKRLAPFGVEVRAAELDADLSKLSGLFLRHLLDDNPFVLLRGFRPLEKADMERYWQQLGTTFSAPQEFVAHDRPTSHLFGRERVPLHCDEILTGRSPSYSVSQCYGAQEPGDGGEMTLCDSTRVLGRLSARDRRRWGAVSFDYRVPGCVSVISQPLVSLHANGRVPVLRYAEPFDRGALGFLECAGAGMSESGSRDLVLELEAELHAAEAVVSHTWQLYDILITDNRRILHGRSSLRGPEPYPYHLQRIHVFS
jgi:alpha-ketoglutarate-dependent taurine dioxygenase